MRQPSVLSEYKQSHTCRILSTDASLISLCFGLKTFLVSTAGAYEDYKVSIGPGAAAPSHGFALVTQRAASTTPSQKINASAKSTT
jgi:hypothetical protein